MVLQQGYYCCYVEPEASPLQLHPGARACGSRSSPGMGCSFFNFASLAIDHISMNYHAPLQYDIFFLCCGHDTTGQEVAGCARSNISVQERNGGRRLQQSSCPPGGVRLSVVTLVVYLSSLLWQINDRLKRWLHTGNIDENEWMEAKCVFRHYLCLVIVVTA